MRDQRIDIAGLPPKKQVLLAAVERFGFLNTTLATEFYSGAPCGQADVGSDSAAAKLARRDLGKLVADGHLKSFSMRKARGAPENVYCLAETRVPRDLMFLPHLLEANRLAMIVQAACQLPREAPYFFDFLLEHEALQKGEGIKDTARPDLVFTVGSAQGRGLYLAEIDRSNEPLSASDRKRASICRKLEWYAGLGDDELRHYCEAFQHEFHGFRAIVVTSRPESITRACCQVGTGDVIGVAGMGEVTVEAVLDKEIWAVPGLHPEMRFKLNWHPDDVKG